MCVGGIRTLNCDAKALIEALIITSCRKQKRNWWRRHSFGHLCSLLVICRQTDGLKILLFLVLFFLSTTTLYFVQGTQKNSYHDCQPLTHSIQRTFSCEGFKQRVIRVHPHTYDSGRIRAVRWPIEKKKLCGRSSGCILWVYRSSIHSFVKEPYPIRWQSGISEEGKYIKLVPLKLLL